MSYESPIEIVFGEMKYQLENDIYSVVQSYDIKVDKDELIKALKYDREQYQQGYSDAKAELERKKGEWIHDGSQWANRWICSECEYKWFHSKEEAHFCPNCGAEM